jgi:precorrin-6A/cobalt-precorrin-6A reductase
MNGSARIKRILILGGTAEARKLAGALATRADLAVTLSLAGRTAQPLPQPVPLRVGGFGGAHGLAEYLRAERIDALINATHPYAAAISANAAEAARVAHAPLLALRRAAWRPVAGDHWIEIETMELPIDALRRCAAPRVSRARAEGARRSPRRRSIFIWCEASIPSIRRLPCPRRSI